MQLKKKHFSCKFECQKEKNNHFEEDITNIRQKEMFLYLPCVLFHQAVRGAHQSLGHPVSER